MNPSIAFPMLEILLGGSGKTPSHIDREMTEIEQNVLEGVHRVVLHDLCQAWHNVTDIEFGIEARKTEPQLLQIMAPNEALVAIGLEIRIGESSGLLNLGFPSLVLKMLRQRFEQQWAPRRAEPSSDEKARTLRLVNNAVLRLDARLTGPKVLARDLMRIGPGDVLVFDFPLAQPLELTVNGRLKFHGTIAASGQKRVFVLSE